MNLHLKAEGDILPLIEQAGITVLSATENGYDLKVTGEDMANALLSTLVGKGIPIISFDLREPSLHEIFVEKVGNENEAL